MKPPLLLIGTGTDDNSGTAEFGRFVHRLRCRLEHIAADVCGGFLDRSEPRLRDSVASLVARGHHRIVVLPLVLTEHDQVLTALRAALAREQERHPTLRYDLARPLGPDLGVLGLLAERLADAEAEIPRLAAVPAATAQSTPGVSRSETAIVLVGGGSTDPAGNADVHRTSRLLWETYASGYLTVETAYMSPLTRPGVAGGLERCRRLGAKRAIVLPYHVFADSDLERVWAQAMAYAAGHDGLDIRCAEAIGDCEGLADVVIERYEEALTVELADRRQVLR
ncbi:cobalamin biosynthesis protein CbiX [Thermopolyspora flexuosa]|uniref:Sirohydrochlorin cobaltochelatase n=1 Tax=Thermopolyspora flexuosa TaxID=103836 RepID=A0A543IV00_9ACTN|nr:sirohydrochlorin chelatase [Thermopolyspora flexuosa]TQM74405.1 sirohydrochlorin cobaltochelatase [Thermopolyspora flexuosa]GGM90840.1 cobalamin biosynthesis protein CbiX [Thermopolyspora flexuosa]